MYTFIVIFALSGIAIVLLLGAKYLGGKRKKTFLILELISKGDLRVRALAHDATHAYSVWKDKGEAFVTRQLPMHSKNWFNKSRAMLKDQTERQIGNIRNSRLLKKSDGLSEYFKSMSSIEKGSGEINDIFEDDKNNGIK